MIRPQLKDSECLRNGGAIVNFGYFWRTGTKKPRCHFLRNSRKKDQSQMHIWKSNLNTGKSFFSKHHECYFTTNYLNSSVSLRWSLYWSFSSVAFSSLRVPPLKTNHAMTTATKTTSSVWMTVQNGNNFPCLSKCKMTITVVQQAAWSLLSDSKLIHKFIKQA